MRLARAPRPRLEINTLSGYYGAMLPRLRVRWGRWVLIEAPKRDRVEVYREDRSRLEMFAGYLDEQAQGLRARLLRAWVRGYLKLREDPYARR